MPISKGNRADFFDSCTTDSDMTFEFWLALGKNGEGFVLINQISDKKNALKVISCQEINNMHISIDVLDFTNATKSVQPRRCAERSDGV